ncbi:MAG TPA: glycosyltransferase family 2 protein [Longimicrobium sp.]|jgi:GT2 family glycosyltransferase
MSTTIIVPVFNGGRFLPAFFRSLGGALPHDSQLIFVDDGSTEPVLENLPEFPNAADVVILRNRENLGYSVAVNRGFGAATGEFIVQLNTDLILDPACITSMLALLQAEQNAGIVGSKLLYPTTRRVQHIGMGVGHFTKKHIYHQLPVDHPLCRRTRPMQIMTGATVAMTRRVLDRIGPLDERYFNAQEDLDHCMRAVDRGYVNYVCADSVAYHWVSQSGASRFARVREADAAFWATWHGRIRVDLGAFVDEAIDSVVTRYPHLAEYDFELLNLCRSGDDAILLDAVGRAWPRTANTGHHHRQVNNPDAAYWLPMLVPYWVQSNPRPFIYLVDHFQQLRENWLWFHERLELVRDELIVDTTGCVVTASELLSMEAVG